MARVDKNANVRWVALADKAIHKLALERDTLTADDVWWALSARETGGDFHAWTHEPRALGPRMLAAARLGWIRKGGTVLSTRGARHQAPIQVWTSLLRGKPEIPRWTDDLLRMDTDARYDLLRVIGVLDEEGGYRW